MEGKFWKIMIDSNQYRSFSLNTQVHNPDDDEYIMELNKGISMLSRWKPLSLILYEDDKRSETKKNCSDFMGYLGPAINEKARSSLSTLIEKSVEFLPLSTPIGKYWMMNINAIDCLNESKSDVKRFSSGKIMRVVNYSFYEDKLQDVHLFILNVGTDIIVSNTFREVYDQNNLTGLKFYPLAYQMSLN
jgi:hypothetical protein